MVAPTRTTPRHPHRTAAAYMLGACTLWGVVGALTAYTGYAYPGGLLAGAAATLWYLAARGGTSPLRVIAAQPRTYAALAAVECVNTAGYYTAITIGPPTLVAALHLSSPLVAYTLALVTRRTRFTWHTAAIGTLVLAAVYALAAGGAGGYTAAALWWAAGLALLTACTVVALNHIIRAATPPTPVAGAAAQMVVCAPLLLGAGAVVAQPPAVYAVGAVLAGAVLFGPALLLLWRALALAPVPYVCTVGLSEAPVTGAVYAVLAWQLPAYGTTAAAAAILAAVAVQLAAPT